VVVVGSIWEDELGTKPGLICRQKTARQEKKGKKYRRRQSGHHAFVRLEPDAADFEECAIRKACKLSGFTGLPVCNKSVTAFHSTPDHDGGLVHFPTRDALRISRMVVRGKFDECRSRKSRRSHPKELNFLDRYNRYRQKAILRPHSARIARTSETRKR
jgi:hypothetical protein